MYSNDFISRMNVIHLKNKFIIVNYKLSIQKMIALYKTV